MKRSRSIWRWRPWSKKLGRRQQTGPFRGVLAELAFYLGLIFVGVFVLTLVLVTQVMMPRIGIDLPEEARVVLESDLAQGGGRWGRWVVAVISVATIGSGMFGLSYRLLHLGFSQERISASRQGFTRRKSRAGLSEQATSDEGSSPSILMRVLQICLRCRVLRLTKKVLASV